MKLPKGKKFYGTVTVSERGQIVIPADARRDFGIEVGDKLLVTADLDKGIAIVKASVLIGKMTEMLNMFQSAPDLDDDKKEVWYEDRRMVKANRFRGD
jgi:AbrB family looped-hinge helix DNA binding protein